MGPTDDQHHYLKERDDGGRAITVRGRVRGQWMALIGWAAGAYHLKGRDGWMGGTRTNGGRDCIWWPITRGSAGCGTQGQYPNLASRALALNLERLSADWQAQYGHPIMAVESFVDEQLFRGTAYKATGWRAVGTTAKYRRVREDFYEAHDRPKQLYVQELVKGGAGFAKAADARRLGCAGAGDHAAVFVGGEELTVYGWCCTRRCREPGRARVAAPAGDGVGDRTFAYLLSGGQGGHRGVALFAQDLSARQRTCGVGSIGARASTTCRRRAGLVYQVLKAVPVQAFQAALWAWQKARGMGRPTGRGGAGREGVAGQRQDAVG